MPIKGFEQLAQDLPEDERKGMHKKLKDLTGGGGLLDSGAGSSSDKNNIALGYSADEITNLRYIDKIYKEVPIFEKIRMFFLKVFAKKSIETLVQEYALKKIGNEIESGYPGLADIKSNKLKEQFCNEINILTASFEHFVEAINHVNKNNVAKFYRYLASREMTGFEEILKKSTTPENIIASDNSIENENIRGAVTRKFNEIVDSIEPEEKSVVYELAKAFFFVDKLVNFPYDAFKKMFVFDPPNSKSCSFTNARKLLAQLDAITASLSSEAIQFDRFFNYLHDYVLLDTSSEDNEFPEKPETTSDSSAKMVKKGVNAISVAGAFRKAVPLTKILRFITKNVNYSPAKISGGEEWLSVYKKILKDEADARVEKYLFNQKKKGVLSRLKDHISEIPGADGDFFILEHKGRHHPLKKCNSLFYLKVFHEKYYIAKMEIVVSKIMIDGVFYKDANKKELIEAFDLINKFSAVYNDFLHKITSFDADPSEQIMPAQEDPIALLRRRKTDYLVKTFTSEGLEIYKTYYAAFISVKNILGGVLSGTHTGEYDTISNLPVLCEEKSIISVPIIEKIYRQSFDLLKIISEYNELIQQ
ncbi:MAG: DUF5312 domain-containing protein [Spirochaetes bacterium]|nr:DUF5312 domain-containing protein [Spirochaetota bacterium]